MRARERALSKKSKFNSLNVFTQNAYTRTSYAKIPGATREEKKNTHPQSRNDEEEKDNAVGHGQTHK